jgi:hypothetical protein
MKMGRGDGIDRVVINVITPEMAKKVVALTGIASNGGNWGAAI